MGSYPRLIAMQLLTILLSLAFADQAFAGGAFYVETGGGLAQVRSADAFLPGATPASGALNLALNVGIFRTFSLGSGGELHFGIDSRYDSGTGGAQNFTILTPYLDARLQFSIFYFGGGYSPYVLRRIESLPGFSNLDHVSGFAYMGEAGLLWPITPKFTMGAAANAQWISSAGALSPSPIIEATGFMRFYFGFSGSPDSSSQNSSEWKGYRYPFGHELR